MSFHGDLRRQLRPGCYMDPSRICLIFQSGLAENGLELVAKDMRTQPASRNSIPTSPNLDFGTLFFWFLCFSCVLEPQNRASPILPEKCLTEVGYIDAD